MNAQYIILPCPIIPEILGECDTHNKSKQTVCPDSLSYKSLIYGMERVIKLDPPLPLLGACWKCNVAWPLPAVWSLCLAAVVL